MNCFFKGICAVTTTWAAVTIGAVGACVILKNTIDITHSLSENKS
jgi:hypothetical protein